MPQLSVEVPHALTPAQAKARLKEKIDSARDSFGGQVNALQEDWDEQGVSFSFQAVGMRVAGRVRVESRRVHVTADLPLAAIMFRGVIEDRVRQELANVLA